MLIKKIEDYTMLYENDDLSALLSKCIFNPNEGKVQNVAQSVYAKTQGVIYAAYSEETKEAIAILGGSRIDNTHFIIKHHALADGYEDLNLINDILEKILDDYRFLTLEAECSIHERKLFKLMGFQVKEIKDHPLDILAFECTQTVKY